MRLISNEEVLVVAGGWGWDGSDKTPEQLEQERIEREIREELIRQAQEECKKVWACRTVVSPEQIARDVGAAYDAAVKKAKKKVKVQNPDGSEVEIEVDE